MSPSWASPGLGTGKGHATPLPQGAPCRAGGADGPVSRRFCKKCDAGSSPGVHSGSGLPPAPPSGAQRWAGRARRTPEGSLGCSRDVNTVPCIPRVLFVQQPDHPPRPGSSCPLRTGQGRALQPPSLPGPSPNAYLYVCLSVCLPHLSTSRSRSGSSPRGRCGSTSCSSAAPWSTCTLAG